MSNLNKLVNLGKLLFLKESLTYFNSLSSAIRLAK